MMDNSNDELEKFKTEINLACYLEDMGFIYDSQKSTRNIPAFKGKNEYEVFIVSKKSSNGHHVFMNPYNEQDAGTIIDFVQNRKKINLGEVRKHLRSYIGHVGNRPLKEYHNYKTNKLDLNAIRVMFAKATPLKNRDFMYSRGITDKTLDSAFLKNRIGNQPYTHSNGTVYVNTVFPIYNLDGLAGLERRNEGFKQAAEDSNKADGMWLSAFDKEFPQIHSNFFISESPIDCISKFQLNATDPNDISTLYFASNGSLNKGQLDFVQHYINLCKPNNVMLGNDNDTAGARFNANYLGNLCDYIPSFEQNHIKFFLSPVTGDKTKCHMDITLLGSNERLGQIRNSLINDLNNLDSKNENAICYPVDNGEKLRLTFDNKQSEIVHLTELISKYRPLKSFYIDKPFEKDFNEDIKMSNLQNKNEDIKVSNFQKKNNMKFSHN